MLPDELRIVGTARTELDDDEFRERAREALEQHLPAGFIQAEVAERFLKRLNYVALDVTRPEPVSRAGGRRSATRTAGWRSSCRPRRLCSSATIAGLQARGPDRARRSRMALEKPLGTDLASSREINDAVAAAFPEERIFRIDHYLGKETVQNLLALRFANSMFEPLWNAAHIDHVQITVAETVGLEGRGDYYDGAGALRDMVQNHMLQLLALVAMEPPTDFDATAVRDEKVKVLRSLRPISADDVDANTRHRPVSRAARSMASRCPATTRRLGRDSQHRDLRRAEGPHRQLALGGRALLPAHRQAHARARHRDRHPVQMRAALDLRRARGQDRSPTSWSSALQPEETIRLMMMAKTPGLDRDGIRLREVPLDLGLANAFADRRPRAIAYERLLLDLIEGDPTLFVRRDEVEAQWAWIDGIRAAWAEAGLAPRPYAAGTWGPSAAIALTERDGVSWHE